MIRLSFELFLYVCKAGPMSFRLRPIARAVLRELNSLPRENDLNDPAQQFIVWRSREMTVES